MSAASERRACTRHATRSAWAEHDEREHSERFDVGTVGASNDSCSRLLAAPGSGAHELKCVGQVSRAHHAQRHVQCEMRHKFEKSLDLEISAAYNLYSTWVRETTRNNLIFCDLSYAYGVY